MLPYRMDPTLFTQYQWCGGSTFDVFGFHLRQETVGKYAKELNSHIIGYCKGEELFCRKKKKHIALMFEKNNIRWWTHVTNTEFASIIK